MAIPGSEFQKYLLPGEDRRGSIVSTRWCWSCDMGKKKAKTYNSGDSLVVTHLTTNPPVHCLYMAERTGSLILSVLWSYVKERGDN